MGKRTKNCVCIVKRKIKRLIFLSLFYLKTHHKSTIFKKMSYTNENKQENNIKKLHIKRNEGN